MPSASPSSQCGFGLKIEVRLFAPALHCDVVGFGHAGGNFIARQVWNARERKPHLLIELRRGLVQFFEPILQGPRLIHHGGSVLAGFLQRAYLLAKLIAARLQLLRLRNGLAAAQIEGSKIAQQSGRVSPSRTQFFFYFFQVSPDKSQVEHLFISLLDRAQYLFDLGWPLRLLRLRAPQRADPSSRAGSGLR